MASAFSQTPIIILVNLRLLIPTNDIIDWALVVSACVPALIGHTNSVTESFVSASVSVAFKVSRRTLRRLGGKHCLGVRLGVSA